MGDWVSEDGAWMVRFISVEVSLPKSKVAPRAGDLGGAADAT